MKKIFCSHYGKGPTLSDLNYDSEIKASMKIISDLILKNPDLTIDEAYLLFRNSVSGVVTYTIVETEDEEQ